MFITNFLKKIIGSIKVTNYNVYEYDNQHETENFVCGSTNLTKCVNEATEYIRIRHGLYGDTIEIVKENLLNRRFYICAFGRSSIEIREE